MLLDPTKHLAVLLSQPIHVPQLCEKPATSSICIYLLTPPLSVFSSSSHVLSFYPFLSLSVLPVSINQISGSCDIMYKVYQKVKFIVHGFHLWNVNSPVDVVRISIWKHSLDRSFKVQFTLVDKVRTVDTLCAINLLISKFFPTVWTASKYYKRQERGVHYLCTTMTLENGESNLGCICYRAEIETQWENHLYAKWTTQSQDSWKSKYQETFSPEEQIPWMIV